MPAGKDALSYQFNCLRQVWGPIVYWKDEFRPANARCLMWRQSMMTWIGVMITVALSSHSLGQCTIGWSGEFGPPGVDNEVKALLAASAIDGPALYAAGRFQ